MNEAQVRISPLHLGIAALALATALIHIVLAIPDNFVVFYLNGLGYIALAVALILPQFAQYRRWVRYALLAFTAVTVLGWAAVGERSAIAYVDKLIELALIALLVMDMRRAQ
jgi:hypothetical protein